PTEIKSALRRANHRLRASLSRLKRWSWPTIISSSGITHADASALRFAVTVFLVVLGMILSSWSLSLRRTVSPSLKSLRMSKCQVLHLGTDLAQRLVELF